MTAGAGSRDTRLPMGRTKNDAAKAEAAIPTRRSVCDRCNARFDVWSNYGGGHYEDDLVGTKHLFGDGEPTRDPVLRYYGDLLVGTATTTLCLRCARATVGGTR